MSAHAESDPPERRAENGPAWLPRVVVAALAAVLVFLAWAPIREAARAISVPYSIDREEGFLVEQGLTLMRGGTIYPDLEGYPFVVGNYPPAFPLLAGLVSLATGPEAAAGRIPAFASGLALLALAGVLAWRACGRPEAGVLAAGLLATTFDFATWLPFARVDLTAIMLTYAGLVVALLAKTWRGWLAVSVVFALAFLTKQTQIVAPAAVLAWLAVGRRYAEARMFASMGPAVALGSVVVLVALTGGAFWAHTVTYNANEFSAAQAVVWVRHFARWQAWVLGAAAALCVAIPAIARGRDEAGGRWGGAMILLLLHAVLSLPLVLAAGKVGAAQNYLIETQAALAVFVAAGLGASLATVGRARVVGWVSAGLLAAHVLLPVQPGRFQLLTVSTIPVPAIVEAGATMELALGGMTGDVLSEDPLLSMRLGRDVLYQPFIMSTLAREGRWDESRLVGDIRARRFVAIVTMQDLVREARPVGFSDAMRAAVLEAYELRVAAGSSRESARYLYVPRRTP